MNNTTYNIPSENLDALKAAVAKLSKRAVKLGSASIEFEVLGHTDVEVVCEFTGNPTGAIVRTYQVRVEGEAPTYDGWTFAAKIENGAAYDGGPNLTKKINGDVELPARFASDVVDPTQCDHCKARRNRKDTFVVVHEDGRVMQVGRRCLRDFLGHNNPESLAKSAELLFTLEACCEEYEEGRSGPVVAEIFSKAEFLGLVCMSIREDGFISRANAGPGGASTSDVVFDTLMENAKLYETNRASEVVKPDEADYNRAAKIIAWAPGFLTDDAVKGNDYLTNLKLAFDADGVSRRLMGLLASLPACYRREAEKAVKAAAAPVAATVFFGEVKTRYTLTATVEKAFSFETDYGTKWITILRDDAGHVFKYFGNSLADAGDVVTMKATVKSHEEYNNENQTVISRPKVSTIEPAEGENGKAA